MEDLQIHSSGVLVDEADPPIEKFTFSFDGSYLGATCSASNYIWVFNLKNKSPLEIPLKITADNIVTSVAISSNFICAGFIDGKILIYNINDGNLVTTLKNADGVADDVGDFVDENDIPFIVHSVKFSPDGTKILSGFGDGFVRLFNITENQEPPLLYEHKYDLAIRSVLFSNDGNDFYTSSADGNIYITNSMSFEQKGILRTRCGSSFSTLCITPKSNYIYAISAEYQRQRSEVYLFDTKQNDKPILSDIIEGYVSSISTDGEYFCACSLTLGLIFYQVPLTLKLEDYDQENYDHMNYGKFRVLDVKQARKEADKISCCAYSPDGKYLFLGGKKITKNLNPMAIWNPEGHAELVKNNSSSSVRNNIMTFFLSNSAFTTKLPMMVNNYIFGHLKYYQLVDNNPYRFISTN